MQIRVAGIVEVDNKVLTMRYLYGNANVYAIPGGNLEFGEAMKEALIREYEEELGITTEVIREAFTCETTRDAEKTLHQFYYLKIVKGKPKLNPAETTALEVCWLATDSLDKFNLYPNVGTYIRTSPKENDKYIGDVKQQWF